MAKPLALTSGEPAGIGPDITIKAWLRRDELKLPAFYLLGDRDFLGNRAKALGLNVRLADVRAEDALDAFADALPVVATGHAAAARPGQPDNTSADAAMSSPDGPARLSPIRLPRAFSTAPDSGIPVIPSFSPNSRRPGATRRNLS
jgi:4-hydroxy-L-threonine phosphate dehydrogenase PdxA